MHHRLRSQTICQVRIGKGCHTYILFHGLRPIWKRIQACFVNELCWCRHSYSAYGSMCIRCQKESGLLWAIWRNWQMGCWRNNKLHCQHCLEKSCCDTMLNLHHSRFFHNPRWISRAMHLASHNSVCLDSEWVLGWHGAPVSPHGHKNTHLPPPNCQNAQEQLLVFFEENRHKRRWTLPFYHLPQMKPCIAMSNCLPTRCNQICKVLKQAVRCPCLMVKNSTGQQQDIMYCLQSVSLFLGFYIG